MFAGVEETDEMPELPTEVVAPFNLTASHLQHADFASSRKISPYFGRRNVTLKSHSIPTCLAFGYLLLWTGRRVS
jgi:hypothetical protein